jgi:hypothetical protein
MARALTRPAPRTSRQTGAGRDTVGNKQERVRRYILEQAPPEFRRRDIERAMPGVSLATIRLVLNDLREEGRISVDGAGPGARWRRS